ncbi:MAG: aminotransferase class III-fold pyridoxal phosphate-dependent enzyme [Patescibacteria group bacterium]|nr:aminotransferase class III-fold pyridoxal phosphate-dependent enzyme [Patescibacteria group bacterium]
MKFDKSKALLKEAKKLMPNASQTLSKGYKMFIEGDFPLFVSRGKGCYIWDVDGNKYIDYTCALAPIIIGYSHDGINKAIIKQLYDGITYSLPHKIETELAKRLVEIIPCADMVRFAKNGMDVTSAAVRIARAYTGKDIILRSGYHGGQDWYLASQPPQDLGVPEVLKKYIDVFKYNDVKDLKAKIAKHKNKIAAVIMEPVPMEDPKKGYLETVRKITRQNGILLIFDEIVTGFRMALGGAQEYYKVVPDLACFGKAMANGMPISCVVGKRKIMAKTEDVFLSITFGGEALSMASAIATIDFIKRNNVLKHNWRVGKILYDGLNKLINKYKINARLIGQVFKFKIIFNDLTGRESNVKKLFFLQQAVFRGVFFGTSTECNYSHQKKDIELTLRASEEILKIMRKFDDDETKLKKMIKGKLPVNKFYRDQR